MTNFANVRGGNMGERNHDVYSSMECIKTY